MAKSTLVENSACVATIETLLLRKNDYSDGHPVSKDVML